MSIRDFIAKLRSLPNKQKKIILWTVVAILGLAMGVLWFKTATSRFTQIEQSVKKINIPSIEEVK